MTEGVFMFNLVWFTRTLQIVSYRHPASFHSSTLVFKATVNSENQIFWVFFFFRVLNFFKGILKCWSTKCLKKIEKSSRLKKITILV